jgi:hypothetical protein
VFLVSWLGYVAIQTLHRVEADFAHSNMLMAAHHFLSFGLGAVLYGFAAWLLVADRYWTVCLWVQCGLSVLDAFSWLPLAVSSAFVVFQAARTITSCASILIVVWVIVAVALDWQRRRRRDWLHWAGVAVVVSSTLLMLASSLWFWLVNRFP